MNLSNSYIIDTNVLVVANGKYEKANYEHIHICEKFLSEMMRSRISIDSGELILKEYFVHANLSGQPGMGDAFVKWLYHNQFKSDRCERVKITPDENCGREFIEFPDDEDLKNFDRDDRKFVAVAINSKFDAIISNATDSDWWKYKDNFEKHGIKIKFLCPDLIKERN